MIRSNIFHKAFDRGFSAAAPGIGIVRASGKPCRFTAGTTVGEIGLWFRVNPKASPIPNQPGEFWPVIEAPGDLHAADPTDDGTVSWYQYASAEQLEQIQQMRQRVVAKVGSQKEFESELWKYMTEAGEGVLRLLVEQAPEPRFPHTRLFYLDADDAEEWGRIFGGQVDSWVHRFAGSPETLVQYMTRVHWTDLTDV